MAKEPHEYLRCPLCGMLRKAAFLQAGRLGFRHKLEKALCFFGGRGRIRWERHDMSGKAWFIRSLWELVSEVQEWLEERLDQAGEAESSSSHLEVEDYQVLRRLPSVVTRRFAGSSSVRIQSRVPPSELKVNVLRA